MVTVTCIWFAARFNGRNGKRKADPPPAHTRYSVNYGIFFFTKSTNQMNSDTYKQKRDLQESVGAWSMYNSNKNIKSFEMPRCIKLMNVECEQTEYCKYLLSSKLYFPLPSSPILYTMRWSDLIEMISILNFFSKPSLAMDQKRHDISIM